MNQNLEKIWEVWNNIDSVYEKSFAGGKVRNKQEFLLKMTSDAELVKIRTLIMKDFEENEESTEKLTLLMDALKRAHQKAEETSTIDSLYDFVWESDAIDYADYILMDRGVTEYSHNALPTIKVIQDDSGMLTRRIYKPGMNAVYFANNTSVMYFLGTLDENNEFHRKVAAYIYYALKDKKPVLRTLFSQAYVDGKKIEADDFAYDTQTLKPAVNGDARVSYELFDVQFECVNTKVIRIA